MLPEIWGKHAWILIHCVALDYPISPSVQDRENYRKFYMSLPYVLPCSKCRNNLVTHLKKIPLTDSELSSRSALLKWTIDLHNVVIIIINLCYHNKKLFQKSINLLRQIVMIISYA